MYINYSPLGFLISLFIVTFLAPQVKSRAFYVFGDSLSLTMETTITLSPLLALIITREAIGMPSTLPYLSPQLTGENLLVGANFASAGIGILNDTGIQFVNIIRISKQFEYFEQYQQRVSALIGPEAAQQLKLYELGARRVLVTGTGAMGCAPAELAQHSRNGECYGALQTAAALFNPRLVDLIASVNAEIGQDVFVAANAYQMNMDYLSNPEQFGNYNSSLISCN
ncbi:unnamed protein product [Eruca vesicaria subsp. sativa]|uniref:Uncharacterized protein n=1 Tax=Eruca vesicaria subsp. sativa TaxID=29727 RepID=A0ABC8LY63_ERUVS|nr:unnamed protein product [Eruca vesicaria subsp. sativa]